MNINWKVRIKNKNFWLTMIPTLLLMIEVILSLFGVEIDLGDVGDKLIRLVNLAFIVLALFGVVNDPTTVGMHDSQRALTYETPNDDSID